MDVVNEPVLTSSNLINIRRWCVDRTIELLKSESVLSRQDMGICGVQDLKCQLVDCAEALSEYILNGKKIGSTVGKTPLLLSATRLLRDRNICLSTHAFNVLMQSKGLLRISKTEKGLGYYTLTETGKEYGEDKAKFFADQDMSTPYYYDNKFDGLLLELKLSADAGKASPKTVSKTKKK